MSGYIGKVTYKASNVTVLQPRPRAGLSDDDVNEMRGFFDEMVSWCRSAGEIGALVIVAVDMDGHFNRATKLHRQCFIGPTLLPSFVADVLRRDTMKNVVEDRLGLEPRGC